MEWHHRVCFDVPVGQGNRFLTEGYHWFLRRLDWSARSDATEVYSISVLPSGICMLKGLASELRPTS